MRTLSLVLVAIFALAMGASAQVSAKYNGGKTANIADPNANPVSPQDLGLTSATVTSIDNNTSCAVIIRVYCYNTSAPQINRLVAEVGLDPNSTMNFNPAVAFSCEPGEEIAITFQKNIISVPPPVETIVIF